MKIPKGYRVEYLKDVTADDLKAAEEYLQMSLPASYKKYLLEKGRFRLVKESDDRYPAWEILHPKQAIARIQSEIDEFDETCFGEAEEDIQTAYQELERRKRLYPFQYRDSYVADFWCFFLDSQKGDEYLIVLIYHDDYELYDFLKPNVENDGSEEFAPYSFEGFIEWHFKEMEQELSEWD